MLSSFDLTDPLAPRQAEGIKIELLPATMGSSEQCENRRKKKSEDAGLSRLRVIAKVITVVSKRVRRFHPTGCCCSLINYGQTGD